MRSDGMEVKMIEKDTIRLLRECDEGVKMGVSSINDVLGDVRSNELKSTLTRSRDEHERLAHEIEGMLNKYHDEGKDPPMIASGMTKLKTEFKLALDGSDSMIAGLMTDGCNMGVKSLSKYLNEYEAAEERAKDIAKKLIAMEQRLAEDMRGFL